MKCGECANHTFLPFDDAAVLAHLMGRQVLGLYPLLDPLDRQQVNMVWHPRILNF